MPFDSRQDFNLAQGPQMNDLWAQLQQMLGQGAPNDYMGGFFEGNFPNEIPWQVRDAAGNSLNRGQDLESYGFNELMGMLPGYFGNVNRLQGGYGGLEDLGNNTLNPVFRNLQQIMNQGLPNQQGVVDMFGGQSRLGGYYDTMNRDILSQLYGGNQLLTPQQLLLQGQNEDFISGGGLTPEYIAAARNQILEPSKLRLKGDLNQMGGGFASLASPEFQQILADQESDFNDSLTLQGFNQLQNFMNRGERLGETGFNQPLNLSGATFGPGQAAYGNAFRSFGDVSGAALPYTQLAGNLGFGALGQGLDTLRTGADLASRPYQLGQQGAGASSDRLQSMMNSLMSGGLDFRGQNLGFQRGNQQDLASLIQSLISERSQGRLGQQQLDAARALRSGNIWGNLIGAGGQALGGYLGKGDGGGGGGSNGGGGSSSGGGGGWASKVPWGQIGAAVASIFSTAKLKHQIKPFSDNKAALDLVTSQPLHTYRYTKLVDPSQKERVGIVLETSDKCFSETDETHMDLVTTIGLLMASVKALNDEIKELRKEVRHD